MSSVYLDVYIGDQEAHASAKKSYDKVLALLDRHGSVYGLPSRPEDLSAEQRDIVQDMHKDGTISLLYDAPQSLLAGRLIVELDPSAGLAKTRANFLSLCSGDKGNCKNAPNKKLHYLNSPIHRVVRDFTAQGGDITRGDGSGGESIYGQKFNCEKAGLQVVPTYGSVAMANSGGKSPLVLLNSSSF